MVSQAPVLLLRKQVKGTCRLCSRFGIIERHHVEYRPEKVIDLCHACHFKVHYFPMRLSVSEIKTLLLYKFSPREIQEKFKTQESLNKSCTDLRLSLCYKSGKDPNENLKEFQDNLAPSRAAFLAGKG